MRLPYSRIEKKPSRKFLLPAATKILCIFQRRSKSISQFPQHYLENDTMGSRKRMVPCQTSTKTIKLHVITKTGQQSCFLFSRIYSTTSKTSGNFSGATSFKTVASNSRFSAAAKRASSPVYNTAIGSPALTKSPSLAFR